MKTPTMAVQASNGRWFLVRYLPEGARYGRSNTLTVTGGDQVEFWDLTHADDGDGFGPLGQFTGGRYYVKTLLGEDPLARHGFDDLNGLRLDGGSEVWRIDGASMRTVRVWLRFVRMAVQR